MNSNLHLVINVSKSPIFSESEDKDDDDEEDQDEDSQDDDSDYGSEKLIPLQGLNLVKI